jgi:hypothetical protein
MGFTRGMASRTDHLVFIPGLARILLCGFQMEYGSHLRIGFHPNLGSHSFAWFSLRPWARAYRIGLALKTLARIWRLGFMRRLARIMILGLVKRDLARFAKVFGFHLSYGSHWYDGFRRVSGSRFTSGCQESYGSHDAFRDFTPKLARAAGLGFIPLMALSLHAATM